ncbi:MAG TPA: DinB family protein [Cytophagaceae bacterium]|nr:DinB family protein [Cytophagaceae bacterium]
MTAEKIYQHKFLPVAKYLLKELEYYGENQFKKKTAASDWTIGQLYHHLIQGTYDHHIKAIRSCLAHQEGGAIGGKSLRGLVVFTIGGYPPYKIKGFRPDYEPSQIESPGKAQDMMFGFLKEMQKLAIEIDKKGDKQYKVKHPRFGMLNAKDWYKLIAMHQNHHLLQKRRIDKILRTFVKDETFSDSTSVS